MAEIKIVSNPYENTISYEKLSDRREGWKDIASDPDYRGRLISSYYTTGFFPFKVSEVLDELVEEYGEGDTSLKIVFEGSDDEFESLEAACACEPLGNKVTLTRSARYLVNARDVIRDVVDMFGELDPLIRDSTEDKQIARQDLDKISEASSNIVPICVLGNYSSGKSTFINALIGAEYLPSAAKPLTSKAYRITRKLQRNGASIKFKLDGSRPVELDFYRSEFSQSGLTKGEPLLDEIEAKLSECKTDSLTERVNRTISVINDFEKDSEVRRISDMVEVEVPFSDQGLLGDSTNNYVIFDTPGSNSASQKNHMEVLKKALEGMSNGIPVFVSVYDQLDSDDADELSEQIKRIEGLDSRFTMIVVSKADQAGLPEGGFENEDVEGLKQQAVVRRLYSNGLYFVSSLMGLGSKNGEEFLDANLRRHFVQQHSAYSDSTDEFYTRLYEYNVMPRQMKDDAVRASEELGNPVFANSGLFCVEYEIENFSNRYAAYNKCRQMEQALETAYNRAVNDTDAEILEGERTRDTLGEKLDEDTRRLVENIVAEGRRQRGNAERGYPSHMEKPIAGLRSHRTREELSEIESRIREAQQQEFNLGGEKEDVTEAWDSLIRGLKRNAHSILQNMDASSLSTARDDMVRGVASIAKEIGEVNEVWSDAKQATVEKLLQDANEKVSAQIDGARTELDQSSRQYWEAQSSVIKDDLSEIIAGASVLPEQTRRRLSEQIVSFSPIEFESTVTFSRDDFELRPFDLVNKGRLARAYNQAVNDAVTAMADTIRTTHTAAFMNWADALEAMIMGNITELSPALHQQAELISAHNQRIRSLRERQAKLQSLVSQVKDKIAWKSPSQPEG